MPEKIIPIRVSKIEDEYKHIFSQRCECGGRFRRDAQGVVIGKKELRKYGIIPPKLGKYHCYCLDIVMPVCIKCGKKATFYFDIIEERVWRKQPKAKKKNH